jgi:ribA/ribD-fused uncharacterized protein
MIREFQGPFRFLSNFYPAEIIKDGLSFPDVERAYQYSKAPLDLDYVVEILGTKLPGQAKRLGRRVKAVPDWDNIKIGIMKDLVRQKFTVHLDLRRKLLATGEEYLEEGNNWGDRFWGVDLEGEGENHLGLILMKVRKELRGS